AHYLIHLYDYPALAQKGLIAANRYAKVAPSAPHAQHMPSHIFTRVGSWNASIASNIGSVEATKGRISDINQAMHAQDYMVYAHLQLAQDNQARDVIARMQEVAQTIDPVVQSGPFALAASPARYVTERGDWAGAMALEVRPGRYPFIEAITHF